MILQFQDPDGHMVIIVKDTKESAVLSMQQHLWARKYKPYTRVDLENNEVDLMYPDEYTDRIKFTVEEN